MAEYKILVVDDEEPIANILEFNLKKEGYDVIVANDGEKAVELAFNDNPDLILLDLMLPKKDGMEVCREVRAKKNIPIIMLTAKNSEIDKVLGLEFGADDYVTKPFEVKELLFRIKAVLRRYQINAESELKLGNLTLNQPYMEISVDAKTINLPNKEFQLLFLLVSNPKHIFTRNDIIEKIWGFDYEGDDRTVDVHIKRLRQKLSRLGASISIHTVRGQGYKVNQDV